MSSSKKRKQAVPEDVPTESNRELSLRYKEAVEQLVDHELHMQKVEKLSGSYDAMFDRRRALMDKRPALQAQRQQAYAEWTLLKTLEGDSQRKYEQQRELLNAGGRAETSLQAIRRLTQELQQSEVQRSRHAVSSSVGVTQGPHCTADSTDMVTLEPLVYGQAPSEGGHLITIVLDQDRPDRRQCYLREQLGAVFASATPLFEYRLDDTTEPYDHVDAPVQRVYLLPPSNVAITGAGAVALMDERHQHYRLTRLPGAHNISAESHTSSAIWNRTDMALFDVQPGL